MRKFTGDVYVKYFTVVKTDTIAMLERHLDTHMNRQDIDHMQADWIS